MIGVISVRVKRRNEATNELVCPWGVGVINRQVSLGNRDTRETEIPDLGARALKSA